MDTPILHLGIDFLGGFLLSYLNEQSQRPNFMSIVIIPTVIDNKL